MRNTLLLFLLSIGAVLPAKAQSSANNLSNLLAEGYTVDELKNIYINIDYENYKKWLKKNGFTFVQEFDSGLTEFKKNDVVSLGIFVKKNTRSISEIFFQSSPQKFYQSLSVLENDNSFTKLADKGTDVRKWHKGGFIYYSRSDNYAIGIYRDVNNEAAASRNSTNSNKVAAGSSSAGSPAPAYVPVKFDFSTAQKFADVLNANMSTAHIGAAGNYSVYDFRSLGKIELAKRSVAFMEKDGELYVRINIPMNGDCDYGLKTFKVKFLNNCTLGMDELCVHIGMEYECNDKKFKDLLVAFPRREKEYAKEDLYHAIVAKFKECCKN